MHPEFRHTRRDTTSSPAAVWAASATQGRGTAPRINRNMLVYLAADSRDYEILDEAVRQYLAWDYFAADEQIRTLEMPPQQVAQANKQLKDADETVWQRILRAYVWLLAPAQSVGGGGVVIDEIRADTAKERLAERASDRLRSADLLRGVQGPQNIRLNLEQYLQSVWSQGHIAVGKLWEYYCQYPYLPRLADRPVLETGILRVFDELTWNVDGFAVATGYVAATGKYTGLAIPLEDPPPSLSDSTLLVHPDRALAQRVAERTDAEARRVAAAEASAANSGATGGAAITPVQGEGTSPTDQGTGTNGSVSVGSGIAPADFALVDSAPKNTRFYGTVRVKPERYVRDIGRLHQEVIQHLAAPEGAELEITIEISAVKRDGDPDDKVRIVSENARALKFDQASFEDG